MKIGTVDIPGKVILAPMAGVTDLAFRTVCRRWGASLTVTEMVSAKALCYQDKKTISLLQLGPDEHPSSVQIFGSDPEVMAEGARRALALSGADLLDLNMGCPTPKIVRSGEGAALMRTPERAEAIVSAVVKAVSVPVTVKMRLGWDRGNLNAVEFARRMEAAGASALCVHGRTRAQMYSGKADWDSIASVRSAISIPLAVNGDLFSPEAAVRAMRRTGAEFAALARGTFGNPFLCGQVAAALDNIPVPPLPPLSQRLDTAVAQFRLAMEQKGEHIAMLEARKHYAWYLKGIPYAGYYKEQIMSISSFEQLLSITQKIRRDLRDPRNPD